ncbi:MAG TPA: hypothetical protein VHZ55_34775 [Bryobacteraceae bacterium]|nr:hypothetical protein [Bryobacteraceae bacterium]
MSADEKMVDAALAGFDQGEFITIPSLPDLADWEAYETARQNLIPKLSLSSPAALYRVSKEHRELQSEEPGLASAARDVDEKETRL